MKFNLQKGNTLVISLVVILAGALAVFGAVNFLEKPATGSLADNGSATTTTTTSTSTTPRPKTTTGGNPPKVVPSEKLLYKDGTYSATGSYAAPSGAESVTVSLTIKGDVVTDASSSVNAKGGASKSYQEIFAANFKQYVVGKNIDNIVLTKVSGSSITPVGFNDALAKIKVQAKI